MHGIGAQWNEYARSVLIDQAASLNWQPNRRQFTRPLAHNTGTQHWHTTLAHNAGTNPANAIVHKLSDHHLGEIYMNREDVTDAIIAAKISKGVKWAAVAEAIGRSKEWTTAALLGQMTFTKAQAETVGKLFGLDPQAVALLQEVPYKGSLPTSVPSDPLIYRFYELVNVYGSTFKALIHEEFGDGIMSAIDFDMHLERQPDPKGDRVKITMSGKFLPYKSY
jgi:cyanate lyase